MKIIHLADLHIASKFERMPKEIKDVLTTKLRNAFSRIIDYAKRNGITAILMSGDIFDKNAVPLSDKKFFYDSIHTNPEIDFYYIKGNHDSSSKCNETLDNLHTFDGIAAYTKEDVRIIGYELGKDNSALYDHQPFTTDKFNILMLHGDIHNVRDDNYIDLKRLSDKNVDYFALGHIHKRESGTIGEARYEYPGSVLGRGYDETGDKGFLVLDTASNSTAFVALSEIKFEHIDVTMNGLNEASLKERISASLGKEDGSLISEIKLSGKADFLVDCEDLERTFRDRRYYLCVKNAAKLACNYVHNVNENSLRNMFINKVLEDSSLNEDTKGKVIDYGLSKLMKEEN